MPDPAATFTNTNDPGRNVRLSQQISWGSPLYVIHKDITKTLESPNSINEIIDGNETEAQYSVVLDVPLGARGFVPFWVINGTFSASTAWPSEFKITCTVSAGTNPVRFFFFGRAPTWASDQTYSPYSTSMTSAPDPSTYGYWHGLAAVKLTTSTSGSDNFIAYGDANNTAATPSAYSLPVAASNGLTRTYIASCHNARVSSTTGLENLIGISSFPASASPAGMTSDSGIIPLFGCDKLTCFGANTSTAPTITLGANMGSGQISNVSMGLAVRFVS